MSNYEPNPLCKDVKWTDKQLDLFARQVDKYYQVELGFSARRAFKPRNNWGSSDHCLICDAFGGNTDGSPPDCLRCPLGDGKADYHSPSPCTQDPEYINQDGRKNISRKDAKARRISLENQFYINGVEIYTADA